MRISSQRQLIAIVVLGVCVLAAAAICLFAPIRLALLALLVVPAVCSLLVLVFLRKTLQAVYQLRDALHGGGAGGGLALGDGAAEELSALTARLDRIERHLPERIAARVAFESARREHGGPSRADSPADR